MSTRRSFLGSVAVTTALFGISSFTRAQTSTVGKRFLFLHAEGGWDPLTVFAPLFSAPDIDMEAAAEPWTIGGLTLVDHPARPQTRAFFTAHHGAVCLLNGVSVRSVNHETCSIVASTGGTSADRADFATILGYERREATSLPHLVMSGPVFPGPYSVFVSNAEGRLQQTIDGTLLVDNDAPLRLPEPITSRMVDRFLIDRSQALELAHPDLPAARDNAEALRRARLLVDSRYQLDLQAGTSFIARVETAIAALSAGLCRSASVGTGFEWDTHQDNSLQSGLFERFFADLGAILDRLATTTGPTGTPLADDTVIVVSSEMARTPALNATGGRDHWPYTSMLLIGPGIRGDQVVGGYSDLYAGIGVDPGGDPDPSQPGIPAESVGATLLRLGDVDPAAYLRTSDPVPGVLA